MQSQTQTSFDSLTFEAVKLCASCGSGPDNLPQPDVAANFHIQCSINFQCGGGGGGGRAAAPQCETENGPQRQAMCIKFNNTLT